MYELLAVVLTAALFPSPVVVGEHGAGCAPDLPARTIQAVTPDIPALAQLEGLSGTSVVRVDLSDTGGVSGAYVAVSSGSSILDRAAIRTAKSMVYAPETRSCRAVPGSYAIQVEFKTEAAD